MAQTSSAASASVVETTLSDAAKRKSGITFAEETGTSTVTTTKSSRWPKSSRQHAAPSFRCKRLEISHNDGALNFSDVEITELGRNGLPSHLNRDVIYIAEITEQASVMLQMELAGAELAIPSSFFAAHMDRGSSQGLVVMADKQSESGESFFGNWSVPVKQTQEYWEIERKIRAGRPYDVDSDVDPKSSLTNHTSYGTWPKAPFRPFYPLKPSARPSGADNKMIPCFAMTRMSLYWKGNADGSAVHGCLLVDPSRQYTFEQVNYSSFSENFGARSLPNQFCFDQDEPGLDRICDQISQRRRHFSGRNTAAAMIECIMALMAQDMPRVLSQLSEGLDDIELSLARDNDLQSAVRNWREYLGHWRNSLVHLRASTLYMLGELRDSDVRQGKQPQTFGDATRQGTEPWARAYTQLDRELEAAQGRVETAFQVLMSTLSILESQRAISQAEAISKLTQLAFFFIPLSFIATVFGSNVVEFQDHFTWRLWVGVSVGLTTATYLVLYLPEILSLVASLLRKIYITWASLAPASNSPNFASVLVSRRVLTPGVVMLLTFGISLAIVFASEDLGMSLAGTVGVTFLLAMSATALMIVAGHLINYLIGRPSDASRFVSGSGGLRRESAA